MTRTHFLVGCLPESNRTREIQEFDIGVVIMKQIKNMQAGILSAIGAYFLWGILPLYWKLVSQVPAHEILAHRIFWSFLFMAGIVMLVKGKTQFYEEMHQLLRKPRKIAALTIGSVFISVNWFIYIWAVNHNRVIETSLGYYINPLFSVLLGILILKERLSFWQAVSVLLAAGGVLYMTLHFGSVPWVALLLAVTFGFYGLCKKIAGISPITSIALETFIIMPVAVIYILYVGFQGTGSFDWSVTSCFLIGTGIVTAVPLMLFTKGANQLPLITLGFIQYLSPTIALMLGVFLYQESFTEVHLLSFCFIWAALLIFSLSRTEAFIQWERAIKIFFIWKNRERSER